ncbi:Ig-like domain-containing protein [Lysobacter sp. ESA13C]|uniref:Ig-like domain-containing protein n=1 Tax=Lysobacter sp. ESA13C TaxID=2862676 RepID=UPI001CBAF608|nr:Ig-like domain-containing protein [Lysobacter sp. ESA13C]
MRPKQQEVRRNWRWSAAALALTLTMGSSALLSSSAGAASEPLPQTLAHRLAADAREGRAQLPDGRWLVLERSGAALVLMEDREGGAALRRWPLSSPRRWASLSLLPSGRVLIWGGVDGKGHVHQGGLWFDPASRSLSSSGPLKLLPRAGHAATVLSDGRLLLTGGWTPGSVGIAQAELWDERSASVSVPKGFSTPPRIGHRSRIENDGRVRLSGGVDGQGRPIAQDQRYDPARQSFEAAGVASAQATDNGRAPKLMAAFPQDLAQGVAPDSRLSLRFDQPLRVAELNAASVTLLGPRGFAAVQVTPAEAGRLLFVTPRQPMQPNAAYSLLVDGVHARNGKSLATTLIDFETGTAGPRPSPQPAAPVATAPRMAAASTTASVSGTLAPDGNPVDVESQTPGQEITVPFTISQTGDYGLGVSELNLSAGTAATVKVTRSGSTVVSTNCTAQYAGCALNLAKLSTGSYVLSARPTSGTATIKFKATLSRDAGTLLQPGIAYPLSLSYRGQNGRPVFNGNANQQVSLRIAGQATLPAGRDIGYVVYNPAGAAIKTSVISAATASINLVLPSTGRYTVLVDPLYGETANVQLTLTQGFSDVLVADGDSMDLASPTEGKSAAVDFYVTAGTKLGLGFSNLALTGAPAGDPAIAVLTKPDGSQSTLGNCFVANGGCDFNLSGLAAGMHNIRLGSYSATARISATATLSNDKTGPVPSTPTPFALDRRGQNARLWFDASAGQTVALAYSQLLSAPANRAVAITVYRPDGTTLKTSSSRSPAATLNLPSLSATGRYSVLIDTELGATVSMDLWLANGVDESLALDGSSIDAAAQNAGQNFYFRMSNPQTGNIGLGFSELSAPDLGNGRVKVSVLSSGDASVHTEECSLSLGGCDLNLTNLASGNYSIVVEPLGQQKLSLRATASTQLTGSLLGETPFALAITRPGQDALLGFNLPQAQDVALGVYQHATQPVGRSVAYSVYKPDGSLILHRSVDADQSLFLPGLAAGAYTIRIDPTEGETASAQLILHTPKTGVLTVDGDSVPLSTQAAGQEIHLSFEAQQGANLGLGISELSGSISRAALLNAYRPDGTQLHSQSCAPPGCSMNFKNLDAGIYTVRISDSAPPPPARSLLATLSSDLEGSVGANAPTTISLNRPGLNGRYRFNAVAGQNLALTISNVATVPAFGDVDYTLYLPDGSQRTGRSQKGYTFNLDALALTGEYMLFVDPSKAMQLSGKIGLVLGESGHIVADGDPVNFATQLHGQSLYFTFDAAQGEYLDLGLSEFQLDGASGDYKIFVVPLADGPTREGYCVMQGPCSMRLKDLAAGRYLVALEPYWQDPDRYSPFSTTATLSRELSGTLSLDQPQTVTIPRHGQVMRMTLPVVAGQKLLLKVAGQSTAPTGSVVGYGVQTPTGGPVVSSGNANEAATFSLNYLTASGDYLVTITNGHATSAQMQVVVEQAPQ